MGLVGFVPDRKAAGGWNCGVRHGVDSYLKVSLASLEGLPGVCDEIGEQLMDLVGICFDGWAWGWDLDFETGVGGQARLEHGKMGLADIGEVAGNRLAMSLADVGQHQPAHIGGLERRTECGGQELGCGPVRRGIFHDQFQAGGDRLQLVIEMMSDGSGHARQTLGLLELAVLNLELVASLFSPFVFGLIDIGTQHATDLSLGIAQRELTGEKRYDLSGRRGQRFFDEQFGQAGGDDLLIIVSVTLRLGLPAHLKIVHSYELSGTLESGVLCEPNVTAEVAKVGVLPEHAHRDGVHDSFDELFGLTELLLEKLGFGDVDVRTDHTNRTVIGVVSHDFSAVEDPFPAPIFAAHAMLTGVAWGATIEVCLNLFHGLWEILGMYALGPFFHIGFNFIGVVAQHDRPALGEDDFAGRDIPVPEAVPDPFERLSPAFILLLEILDELV